jgi:hypothetical protein
MTAVLEHAPADIAVKTTGTIHIINGPDISVFTWDRGDPVSVAAAQAKVAELTRTHVVARATDLASPSDQVRELPADLREDEVLVANGPMKAG